MASSIAGWSVGSCRGGIGQDRTSVPSSIMRSPYSENIGSGLFSSSNAALRTRCWKSRSDGTPRGRPSGKSHHNPRGGAVVSIWLFIEPKATVAMPCASKIWASVLTVRVHNGQTGVRSTTSTSCSLKNFAPAGPLSSRTADKSN